MTSDDNNRKVTGAVGILVMAAAFVVVVAGMKAASSIIVPFLLSIFISIVSAPPLFWLRRKGLPTPVAILVVMSVVFALGLGVAELVRQSVLDFSQQLPTYQARLTELTIAGLGWLSNFGLNVSGKGVVDALDPGAAMKLVGGMLSGLGVVLTNSFLIIITVVFILLEASSFSGKLNAVFTDPGASMERMDLFLRNIQHYMAIKTWISLATGILAAVLLAVIGVDYPILWGLLAFLLNYVPNIGSIIAAVPAVLLALMQLGVWPAIVAAAGYIVINLVMGNAIEPKVMGRGLGLSPLVVFLSLVFWGWVFGPVGMLLSVPLTMTLKIALDSNEDVRWVSVLMGPEVAAAPAEDDAQPKD